MLGFSFSKILVLAFAAFGVFYLFRMLAGPSASRSAMEQQRAAESRRGMHTKRTLEAEDMVRCSVCGTYVTAKNPAPCDNPACPARR